MKIYSSINHMLGILRSHESGQLIVMANCSATLPFLICRMSKRKEIKWEGKK
jgi:hypothetical protein